MRRSRWTPSPVKLAITLLAAVVVLVPLAYTLSPRVHRWRMLGDLDSPDRGRREAALSYISRRAPREAAVREAAIQRLSRTTNRSGFLQLARALQTAGLWDRAHVPPSAWLRWLDILAQRPRADARVFSAHRLAEMTDRPDDPRLVRLAGTLLADHDARVRRAALLAAQTLRSRADQPAAYDRLIGRATNDPAPRVAQQAWIALGLLDPAHGFGANWRAAPPPVAQAILWAALKTNPSSPAPAVAALRDASADPATRAGAAYALHLSPTPAAKHALLDIVDVSPASVTPTEAKTVWRAILALPKPDVERRTYTPLENAIAGFAMEGGDDPLLEPLALAAMYRAGIEGARRKTDHPGAYDMLMKLAAIEGRIAAPGPRMYWPLTGYKPDLLRAMTISVAKSPRPRDMLPALDAADPAMRDLACAVAADRFNNKQNTMLIRECLTSYRGDAKMSGAILAGLNDLRPTVILGPLDEALRAHPTLTRSKLSKFSATKLAKLGLERRGLLAYAAKHETDWKIRQVMRLALWMQGRRPQMDGRVEALLTRTDMPTTTVLLAMMHRGQTPRVLNWLLNPRARPPLDLVRLFDQRRWWHVLRRHLPDDAPPFWVWADPALERFQVQVLRNWWLLNRARLTEAASSK